MHFFTVEQLGPKQSLTPEGFLVCHDVPIARTGTMEYAAIELPQIEADANGVIQVERPPEEVFRPETMASFEGKPVTLDHPYREGDVTPDNWRELAKGVAKNVRRGEGHQDMLLLADLLLTDRQAIDRVRSGALREVSCGYKTEHEQISPGRGVQRQIVGNHIALVKRGRCGSRCSIGDRHMADSKSARHSVADKLRKFFMVRDSEEFEKTLEEIKDDEGSAASNTPHVHVHLNTPEAEKLAAPTPPAEVEKSTQDEPEELEQQLLKAIEALDERLKAVEATLSANTQTDEESAAEEKQESADEASDEDEPKSGQSTHDSTALRDAFQDAKARAEILAPGLKMPTFDAKAGSRSTTDALCMLRRRALSAALKNDHADIVKTVAGGKDVSKLTCDAAGAVFNAASELVKQKNQRTTTSYPIHDAQRADLNQRHAEFWSTHK